MPTTSPCRFLPGSTRQDGARMAIGSTRLYGHPTADPLALNYPSLMALALKGRIGVELLEL